MVQLLLRAGPLAASRGVTSAPSQRPWVIRSAWAAGGADVPADGALHQRARRHSARPLTPSLLPSPLSLAQPSKALNKVTLTKDFKRVAKTIIKNSETNFYRPDLTKGERAPLAAAWCTSAYVSACFSVLMVVVPTVGSAAVLAKWSLIHASQKKIKAKK